MLVLSRKLDESLVVNNTLNVKLSAVKYNQAHFSWGDTSAILSPGDSVEVMPDVVFHLLRAGRYQARVSIDAPRHIPVHRKEIHERILSGVRHEA
ncbi:carbon storage regulator [Aliidiomarina quisquiliarum]|uniref:carbon storage regulator n=1 Tax=Aliidiomarina quisquiliarum TaxID=2938947 RepID=UPI00208E76F5|nr:carbon storage regulator [Aliidiomarina quisquiliarum]MCO4319901.1 carbon storage regulator [Aliidiomarina quisquiliarum]